ncbi:PilZ domain-containing protein [Thiomicrorhabdus aquaedulcis]|uniref:PilZ domain-containing protein n=1 Tax=Thiomicrorhabdus aquaedulcis TaxID=2211106 RepID=UPI001E55FAF0|nr:PilZ domain-containing protein [Thiomicrorhabdus aquaedulcis]
MNTKINFLLQTVDEKQLSRAIPHRLVNLSASGIAIEMSEKIDQSYKVDLLIKPLVNESPVFVRCDVVSISPNKDGSQSSTVALEYQKLTEEDRRKLVYFIQAKEIEYAQEQRRAERLKRNNNIA